MAMLEDNPSLVTLSLVFCVSVFILNSFSVLVTFMLSSVCFWPPSTHSRQCRKRTYSPAIALSHCLYVHP